MAFSAEVVVAVSSADVDMSLREPVEVTEGDDALLAAAARGQPQACQQIYQRFVRLVHGIALAHVPAQDADDVTQEVFVAVFDRIASVRDGAALGAWVTKVARNSAIDHLRRRRRQPRHESLDEVACDPQPDRDPELPARILGLIQTLPEAYRETLVLRLVEGLSGPEIAARTGLTHGSVRVNLCRGMAMLRPQLERMGFA